MVTVPVHVPVRNDAGDGDVGDGDCPPHPASTRSRPIGIACVAFTYVLIAHLLSSLYAPTVHGLQFELLELRVVPAQARHLGHHAPTVLAGDVHDQMDRQGDGLPRAPMRQADVGGQHAMREPRERLLARSSRGWC